MKDVHTGLAVGPKKILVKLENLIATSKIVIIAKMYYVFITFQTLYQVLGTYNSILI